MSTVLNKHAIVVGGFLIISTTAWLILRYLENNLDSLTKIELLTVAYGVILVIFLEAKNHTDEIVNCFKGKKGEDMICSELEKHFDNSYIYIRNYKIPHKIIGDIDGVLISAREIILLEVKYYTGKFSVRDGVFYRIYPNSKEYRMSHNPIQQAKRQTDALIKMVHATYPHIKIRSFVVMASGEITNISGPTGVYVLNKENLVEKILQEKNSSENLYSEKEISDYLLHHK